MELLWQNTLLLRIRGGFAGWRVSVFAAVEPYRTGPFGFPVFAR